MGISRGAIALLAQEAARRPFWGSVVTLGRQRIHASGPEARRQLDRFGVAPGHPLPAQLDDQSLFRALGFETVHSIDYSDYEGATHVLDLNGAMLPDELRGRYDLVLDSGTIEHVFHVPNALKSIVELAKIGGRVALLSPSSNHFDHGFYMFSPTLFCDFFAANKLNVEVSYVVRYSANSAARWNVYRYEPGAWSDVQVGGLDGRPYLNFIVATKTEDSTTGAIPQQHFYATTSEQYAGSTTASGSTNAAVATPRDLNSARRRVRRVLARVPFGLAAAENILRAARRTLRNKPFVGRY